jgi:hypothetical protein
MIAQKLDYIICETQRYFHEGVTVCIDISPCLACISATSAAYAKLTGGRARVRWAVGKRECLTCLLFKNSFSCQLENKGAERPHFDSRYSGIPPAIAFLTSEFLLTLNLCCNWSRKLHIEYFILSHWPRREGPGWL